MSLESFYLTKERTLKTHPSFFSEGLVRTIALFTVLLAFSIDALLAADPSSAALSASDLSTINLSDLDPSALNPSTSSPSCESYATSDVCPDVCIWDCRLDQCRSPTCSDYPDNISCPENCIWNCFSQTCQGSDNWATMPTQPVPT